MRLPWLVCYVTEDGRKLKCFACETEWDARDSVAYLNRCGDGNFCVMRR